MTIDSVGYSTPPVPRDVPESHNLIKTDEIKAILFLGIKGEVIVPNPERTVDILA